jgi:2-polyprenyl-3-methyl-5-hydroxy-6-metoxy-1,4-benzoquinol methylase
MINWSEDDRLWTAMAPALSKPERYSQARKDVGFIEAAMELRKGSAVLDMGCGAGTHATAFALRGYIVTAVDQSECLLHLAVKYAKQNNLPIEFVQGDMRRFVRPFAYDLACSLYFSFAYFDDTINVRILKNIHQSLQSDGVFVLDTIGNGFVNECGNIFTDVEIQGSVYSCHRSFDTEHSMLSEIWTVISNGISQQFSTMQRFYQPHELMNMLQAARFKEIEISASLDLTSTYNNDSQRMVAYARA